MDGERLLGPGFQLCVEESGVYGNIVAGRDSGDSGGFYRGGQGRRGGKLPGILVNYAAAAERKYVYHYGAFLFKFL